MKGVIMNKFLMLSSLFLVAVASNQMLQGQELLTISKTGPATVVPGQIFDYVVTVTNTNDSKVQITQLSDTIAPGSCISILNAVPSGDGTFTPVITIGTTVITSGTIDANGIVTFTVTVQASSNPECYGQT